MLNCTRFKNIIFVALFFSFPGARLYGQGGESPHLVNYAPKPFTSANETSTTITVEFDQAMRPSSIGVRSFIVSGDRTGLHSGKIDYDAANRSASFTTETEYTAGEIVTVILTSAIQSANGEALVPFQWTFYIRTMPGNLQFKLDSEHIAGRGPQDVGIGHFNMDAGFDIVLTHSKSHDIRTWLNSGNGIFTQAQQEEIEELPRSLTVGDFDLDGDPDVAAANEASNSVSILDNDGSGVFSLRPVALPASNAPVDIAHGDLNGDGFPELVTVNEESDNLSIFVNLGNGQFKDQTLLSVAEGPLSVTIVDVTNDGRPDLVASSNKASAVSIFINEGNGEFSAPSTFGVGDGARSVRTADFNLDGRVDIVVANRDDDDISILFNEGKTFSGRKDYDVGNGPFAISARDFDGDLDIDLAVSSRGSDDFYVLLNDGAGEFELHAVIETRNQPRAMGSADFDGDGVLDLAIGAWDENRLQIFLNQSPPPPNDPPEVPILADPENLAFLNPDSVEIMFRWHVPIDPDNDSLHFILEISDGLPSTPVLTFDSSQEPAGFDPTPPVAAGAGLVSYRLSTALADGSNWWRVTAWDGRVKSPPSQARKFTIDRLVPHLDEIRITEPAFEPNWYNQNTISSISFGVEYDEIHAQEARFDLATLGGRRTETGIASGQNQVVQTQVSLDGGSDGTYSLAVALFDSAGNRAGLNTEITLDQTPPSGTRARSPQISPATRFEVAWGDGSDAEGSGLSGTFDVRVQANGGDWSDWQTRFDGSSAVFEGQQGQVYGFEARAYDNVGNVSAFQSQAESETLVDTTFGDVQAPGPPLRLTAGGSSPSPWQVNPNFTIEWLPPSDRSGIARALYKLGEAPSSNFDTTATATSQTVVVSAAQEDGENLFLWFQDNRSNVNFNNHGRVRLRYDQTAPAFNRIDPLNEDFAPNWFNPGITPIAQIEISYDEAHLRRISMDASDLDVHLELNDPASGTQILHLFELKVEGKSDGEYELRVTLTDSAGNAASDTFAIALDATAPTGTQADSPDTSTTTDFTVRWDNTGSDGNGAGLSGAYDVHYQVDDDGWRPWLTEFKGTSAIFSGEHGQVYSFEAAAFDNVGNRAPLNQAAETLTVVDTGFVDVSPPTISHSLPALVNEGEGLTIQAEIEDNVGIAEASLFYRSGGKADFQSVQMTSSDSRIFEASLAPTTIPLTGLSYYISAFDGTHFSFHPNVDWEITPNNLSVRVLGSGNQGLSRSEPLQGGADRGSFRMLSVPLDLEDPSPLAVLEDDLGPYDPEQWRLFEYDSASDGYLEYPNTNPFSPGRALWLIVRQQDRLVDSGIGSSVATNRPFRMTLNQGWNDIAVPFAFAVAWQDVNVVQGNPADVMGPYTYQERWLLPDEVPTLRPWEGYTVYSQTSGVAIAVSPLDANVPGAAAVEPPVRDWHIAVHATCAGLQDQSNLLGAAPQALVAWDKLDFLEPPRLGKYVSLRFPHEDWQEFAGAFTTDFRPPIEAGEVWQFEVSTSVSHEPVTLTFENLESLPEGLQAVLWDKGISHTIALKPGSAYKFLPKNESPSRRFEIIVGTNDFVESSEALNQVPETFLLGQNYPNPFNASTTMNYQVPSPALVRIEILNILGQRVRQLLVQQRPAGVYRVQWDGKSDRDEDVGSGIYLVHFKAADFQQTRKIILVR